MLPLLNPKQVTLFNVVSCTNVAGVRCIVNVSVLIQPKASVIVTV